MKNYTYVLATDFDRAWINFELDLPLFLEEGGKPNPFYINRPYDFLDELTDALLAPYYRPPKFFFSGHRGCGKSTELLRLLNNLEIQRKYWPIYFSVREESDIIDMDFRDIYFSIGSRLYREYRKKEGTIPEQLLKNLMNWKGSIENNITSKLDHGDSGDKGVSLDSFFANMSLKLKYEPATRAELRQSLENDITGMISIINNIAEVIFKQEGRIPLLLIDDIDKADIERVRAIFHDHREIMLQPNCAIVYVVSSALFYSKEFDALRDLSLFLPNINLRSSNSINEVNLEGYKIMEKFVAARMDRGLIDSNAVQQAITYGGGVFREQARIIRTAIGRARRRKSSLIQVDDIEWAATEIRNEYRRILDKEDLILLKKVHDNKTLEFSDRLRPLLQLLALIEYRDEENWCDVHPVLWKML